jgi:hypothetical protein
MYNDRFKRVKSLFKENSEFTNESLNEIESYIEYVGEAMDSMSDEELNNDYEEFIVK